jgi:hypothetical protein
VSLNYRSLILSVGILIRREPALRRRMAYGACGFAGFSLAWTTPTSPRTSSEPSVSASG